MKLNHIRVSEINLFYIIANLFNIMVLSLFQDYIIIRSFF